jgi:prephenate dehydrogenase
VTGPGSMRSIAIVGVGLIGGSVGLALRRKAGFTGEILGVSSARTIDEAVEVGAIDRGVSLEEAAATADVLYLAQPIAGIIATLHRLRGLVRPDCLVTDAGSTKVQIMEAARDLPRFLGGHPMAGKESRGVSSADPNLFEGRTYVFTPQTGVDTELANCEFVSWMSLCGAVPVILQATVHDRIVAFTSHLPQLSSTALAAIIGSQVTQDAQLAVSGSGLKDATRLALSSWDIWADIVDTNRANIAHALDVYIDKLTRMRENLQTHEMGDDFAFAAGVARKVRR